MYDFIQGEIDVLVATTIIETGMDISNVNTIIIHDADNMGLSQLYHCLLYTSYLYSEYGAKHVDPLDDNKQMAFTNVILQCAPVTQYDANGYMQFNILNSTGEGYYITGGKAIPVTWSKGCLLYSSRCV